jgi:hypothetical protein
MLANTDAISIHVSFTTLEGTPGEVRKELTHSKAERVIALAFTHENEQVADAMASALTGLGALISELSAERPQESLRNVIGALAPSVPLPTHMLTEARMAAHARRAVLNSAEWLTAAQIAEQAGFSASNPSAQQNRWKKDGMIFAIHHQNTDYFPAYGLDPTTFRPIKAMAEVLSVFKDSKDAWGLAYWFSSVNSFLGGNRPQDLLRTAPDDVISAAKDELAGVTHG